MSLAVPADSVDHERAGKRPALRSLLDVGAKFTLRRSVRVPSIRHPTLSARKGRIDHADGRAVQADAREHRLLAHGPRASASFESLGDETYNGSF